MPEEWIRFRQGTIENSIVKVQIDPSMITAQVEPIGSLLNIRLSWEWERQHWQNQQLFWEMISLSAELLHADNLIAISFQANAVENSTPNRLIFPLTIDQAEAIETFRAASDFSFYLKIATNMQVIQYPIPNRGHMVLNQQVLRGFHQFQTTVAITIPKSTWEKNVLPNLVLNGLSSLTIIFPPGTKKVFAAPLYELQQAVKTLSTASTEQQFESVVLQCRNAVDSLLNQFTFKLPNRADGKLDTSFGSRANALGEQDLKNLLSESQAKAVSNILKALWEPYSGAAKAGPAHHSHAFASFALHQAASIVKLVSEVLWQKQK